MPNTTQGSLLDRLTHSQLVDAAQLAACQAQADGDDTVLIQSLIAAISSAADQKGILDLQARISAELGMLQNEQIKLQTLFQSATADSQLRSQRSLEQALADVGSMRQLAPLGL